MQKLLGRNYKWWYLLLFSFKSNTAYRADSLMWLASSIILVCGTIIIWYINSVDTTDFGETFSRLFTYFIIGEACIFSNTIQFSLGEDIQEGNITPKLLLPSHPLLFYSLYQFGFNLFENLAKLTIYLAFGLIFSQFLIMPSLQNVLIFIAMIILTYIINNFIGIIVGLSAFWFVEFFGSASFFDNLKLILSGKFFPLNYLKIMRFSLFLPFAYIFYHPMQIYLGNYTSIQILWVFLGGIIWSLVLYLLVKLVFKLGLKKHESVGL